VTCRRCATNFVLLNGQCRAAIANCRRRNANNFECEECEAGYFLSQGSCNVRDNLCFKYQRQGSNDICVACYAGYELVQGSCLKKIFGGIYTNSVVTGCRSPFIFNPQTNTCTINGCQQYNDNGCISCIAPFYILNGNCLI